MNLGQVLMFGFVAWDRHAQAIIRNKDGSITWVDGFGVRSDHQVWSFWRKVEGIDYWYFKPDTFREWAKEQNVKLPPKKECMLAVGK